MQSLEVSGAVRPIYGSLGVKRFKYYPGYYLKFFSKTTALSRARHSV